jgi:hypothetical protein
MFKYLKLKHFFHITHKPFSKNKTNTAYTFKDNKVSYPSGYQKDIDIYMKKDQLLKEKKKSKTNINLDNKNCLVLHPIFNEK